MKTTKSALAAVALSVAMLFSACSTPVEKVEFSHGKVEGTVYSNDMVSMRISERDGHIFPMKILLLRRVSPIFQRNRQTRLSQIRVLFTICMLPTPTMKT